ncbi:MAG: hypothetical protein AAFX07_06955 [Pseudomonadota bacterium]
MCRALLILAISVLVGCAGPTTTDQTELLNIKLSNRLPKSSPSQFVAAFDKYCVEEKSPSARESLLRNANYVPVAPKRPNEPQVFPVDDRRPAVVVSDRLCSVRALSRTGQTQRLSSYIEEKFQIFQPLPRNFVGSEVEQLWQIADYKPALIATDRGHTIDGLTTYAVTIFRP